MANINDYLIWRGDIPIIAEAKFNEVDSMILARFSYLLFDRISLEKQETIESIADKMKDFENDEFNYNGDKQLITNLGESVRFKDLVVTDYIKNNDKEAEKQFSAITIHLSKKVMYLSFLGTDKTILGWKEDFNMSFMENVPSQIEGLKYLEKIAEKYPDKKMILGGHSKGGNVAIYAALETNAALQNRIIKIYNFDGPGFDSSFIDNNKTDKTVKKVLTFIPQDSIIGRIMEHEEECHVVKSVESGLYQHDIYSWQIARDKMVRLDSVTNSSDIMNDSIKQWLKTTTPKQRKIFFDGIFELFYSTEARTFGDINIKSIPTLIKTYRDISEEDRKVIIKMLKVFGKVYFSNLTNRDDNENE